MIASKVPNVTMFTGIALKIREFRLPVLFNYQYRSIPDQGGSQPPPEYPNPLILPTLHECGNCHTTTLEEPSLKLRSGSRLDTSLHKVKWERRDPSGNSCDATCEE